MRSTPAYLREGENRRRFSQTFTERFYGHDDTLRGAGQFDAAPCQRPVRDGIRPGERVMVKRIAGRAISTAHVHDLTQQKEAAHQIARQRDRLYQRKDKRTRIAAGRPGVAHGLNNPLSIVVGHTLSLEEDGGGEQAAPGHRRSD